MNNPTVVDLFCGAGGFSYGFKKAGFDIVLGIDNTSHKLNTYRENISCPVIEKNIQLVSKDDLNHIIGSRTIDVVIGSPPCQFFSNSTRKKSKLDPVTLFLNHFMLFEFIRLISIIKPNFFIIENVPKFFRSDISYYSQYLFSNLGYNLHLEEIDCSRYGVPQKRIRGFLIGTLQSKSISLTPINTSVSIRDAIGDLENLIPLKKNTQTPLYLDINSTTKFSAYQQSMHSKRGNLPIYNHVSPRHTQSVINQLSQLACGDYYVNKNGKYNEFHTRSFYDSISKPITTVFGSPSNDGETMHPSLPRCLTFREAARLQSFDDDFIFYGSDLEIRKQIGDAVPPLISYQYAKLIHTLL